jgi:hypothetical protein
MINLTPPVHHRLMNSSNTHSTRWHPASGRSAPTRPSRRGEAEVVDLATERALRLLAQAGMIPFSAVSRRSVTVR